MLHFDTLLSFVVMCIGLSLLSFSIDIILDIVDRLLSHLLLYLSLHLDVFDFSQGLCLDTLLLADGLGGLLPHCLLLCGDLKFGLLRLNVLIVAHQGSRDVGLGHSNCDDLDSWSPDIAIFLQAGHELLV